MTSYSDRSPHLPLVKRIFGTITLAPYGRSTWIFYRISRFYARQRCDDIFVAISFCLNFYDCFIFFLFIVKFNKTRSAVWICFVFFWVLECMFYIRLHQIDPPSPLILTSLSNLLATPSFICKIDFPLYGSHRSPLSPH